MGQHADDILNGDVDQYTGEWLGDGQGFPQSLEPKKEIRTYDRVNNFNGISNYIYKYHSEMIPNGLDGNQTPNYIHGIIKEFLKEQKIEHLESNRHSNIFKNAHTAQKDWKKFKTFLKNK